MPIGGTMRLDEKDSSNELDAKEGEERPLEAGDAIDGAKDNPCMQGRRPAGAAIGGALGGIGGRRTQKSRLRKSDG